jgi:ketosteroid isomerase-like protein
VKRLPGEALSLSKDLNRRFSMDPIEQVKAVVQSHEEYAAAGDVDGVISNMAPDVVVLAPDSPLVEGEKAVRALYEALFSMGSWRFGHDYSGAEEVEGLVVLYGVARGSMTPPGGEPDTFANNFMITARRDDCDRYRIWRVAFGPSGE